MSITVTQKEWFSKQEAADYLGLSVKTVERFAKPDNNGVRALPTYKAVNRTKFKRSDLDAFMESNRDDPERPKRVLNRTGTSRRSTTKKKKAAA